MIINQNGQLDVVKVDLSYTSTPENGERFVEGEDIDVKLVLSNISSSTITGVEISVEEPLGSSWELEQLEADESQDLTDVYPLQSEDEEAGYVDYSVVVTYTDSDSQEQEYSCTIRMFNEIAHPSYIKHVWKTGDVVTAPDFNHLEEGIEDSSLGISELELSKLDIDSNSDYMTIEEESNDSSTPSSWINVPVLDSGEQHKSIFSKLSKMFSNIRFLYSSLATKLDKSDVTTDTSVSSTGKALDATANNPDVSGSLANNLSTLGTDYATFKQAVIDGEVGGSTATIVTQAEYDALSEAEKNSDTIYFISDAPFDSPNVVTCTRAEYNAMTDATKMDGRFYYVTDDAEVETSLIVDNLTTNNAGYALSAKQGKVLDEKRWKPIDIPATTDINTLLTPNIYACPSSATAGTMTNCPTTEAFYMNVVSLTDFVSGAWASLIQTITDFMGRRVWCRRVSANGEGTWVYQSWQEYVSNALKTVYITTTHTHQLRCYKQGRVVVLYGYITLTSAITAWSSTPVFTIANADDRPYTQNVVLPILTNEAVNQYFEVIYNSGNVQCSVGFPSGKQLKITGTWISQG